MKKPRVSIIVVMSETKRAIGYNNQLLWNLPKDLERFKTLTMGHPIIMGARTCQSIGKPLLGRLNIVITNKEECLDNYVRVRSIEEALSVARSKDKEEVFIIGGESIFKQTMGLADRLYLTIVKQEVLADTFFPEYSNFDKQVSREDHISDGLEYSYLTLEK